MVIATFNVNSIRARLPVLLQWLERARPDVVALQETKVEDDKFPREEIEALGYHISAHGQKSRNGVAFLSREPMIDVEPGLHDPEMPTDARVLTGIYRDIRLVNTYVPNGTRLGTDKWAYKLRWLEVLAELLADFQEEDTLWLGDINIAPTRDDLFDGPRRNRPIVGFHPDEHERLKAIMEEGYADVFRRDHQGPGHYTFWEYTIPEAWQRNLGWRIDHIYATPSALARCQRCWIDSEPRGWERPSDHVPVLVQLSD